MPLKKLLSSAVANAKHNDQLGSEELVVTDARVDEGLTMKRMRPRARGRGMIEKKRTSHISLTVEPRTKKESEGKKAKAAKVDNQKMKEE